MRSMESSTLKCTCITKIEEGEQWKNVIKKINTRYDKLL
jgi:hypothetical protein